jgi:uncharacterized protein (UPF0276 family)
MNDIDNMLDQNTDTKPFHGFGMGLRPEYYQTLLDSPAEIDWFEILSENYMVDGGKPLYFLDQFKERYPIAMHGVSMNIGSTDPLDLNYLAELKKLVKRVQPMWVSDHCCWTGVNAHSTHDLLPLPYNQESVDHFVARIKQIQDIIEQPILIENLSSYLSFKDSQMTEWQFLSEICNRADCYLLLDINNIYVSARNHGFDAMDYIRGVPKDRVMQHHLAGHADHGRYIIDTHDAPISASVFDLYRQALNHFGPVSTMIERDDQFPPIEELMTELEQVKTIYRDYLNNNASLVKAVSRTPKKKAGC